MNIRSSFLGPASFEVSLRAAVKRSLVPQFATCDHLVSHFSHRGLSNLALALDECGGDGRHGVCIGLFVRPSRERGQ